MTRSGSSRHTPRPPSPGTAGFTLVELIMVVGLIGILAGLTAPFVLAAKASSNEASAIGSLRAVNSSQANYATTCASGSYSTSLVTLVAQGYLSPDMAAPSKSGYSFALRAGLGAVPGSLDCATAVPQSAYYASAMPLSLAAGRRAFATNQGGTIWQDTTGAPPAEPFTALGPVAPTLPRRATGRSPPRCRRRATCGTATALGRPAAIVAALGRPAGRPYGVTITPPR